MNTLTEFDSYYFWCMKKILERNLSGRYELTSLDV